ncbi:MAG: ABC transporter ATP-binding protein, partial [Kiritimatiellia bacterium]
SGERVAVCGPNGAGKSTLLRALLEASLRDRAGRTPPAVFVPQDLPAELEQSITAHDYVMLGRTPHLSAWRRPSAADEESVARALESVGLAGFAARRLNEVSGGERRRLAIALALASGAPALLLDESTAHLDVACRAVLFDLLARTGRTIVMAIHEFPLPARFFTRVVWLDAGRVRRDGVAEDAAVAPRAENWYSMEPVTNKETQ